MLKYYSYFLSIRLKNTLVYSGTMYSKEFSVLPAFIDEKPIILCRWVISKWSASCISFAYGGGHGIFFFSIIRLKGSLRSWNTSHSKRKWWTVSFATFNPTFCMGNRVKCGFLFLLESYQCYPMLLLGSYVTGRKNPKNVHSVGVTFFNFYVYFYFMI